ncbi:ATP-binding protein [Aerosakkonema sp. BLCC-F183]|uniref:ATP-binding protein n=1 Tax=Aerosakkonema sp. BLCC-F183 TaxID=3342834 RepID=UPI0035B841AD
MQRERDNQHPTSDPLQVSDALLRATIENLPGGALFVVDRDLCYLLAEGEALATAGFKPEDLVGRTIFEVLAPDLAASYEPMYRQALAGEPFEHEHDAHDRTYISRGTPLRADNGEIYAVLVVSYDITDRKKTEAALRESQTRFRQVFDNNMVAMGIWTPAGAITDANDALLSSIGYTRTDLEAGAIRWSELTPPEYHDRDRQAIAEVKAKGACVPYEKEFIHKDGHRLPILIGSGRFDDRTGTGIFCAFDISEQQAALRERKQAETSLRESEAKYRTLFESIEEGFCSIEVLYDADGQPVDHRILEANRAFERHTGLIDVKGSLASELMPGVEQFWSDFYARIVATGKSERFEHYSPAFNRWFDAEVSRVGDESLHRVAVIFQDITERKQAEAALRESEAKYRSLFNSIDEGFCLIEMIFDERDNAVDFCYLEVNPMFKRQTGLKNVVGKLGSEVAPNTESHWFEAYGNVARTGEPLRVENYNAFTGRWYSAYVSQVGGVSSRRVAIVFDDITERKRYEQQQAYLLQLSDALRSLSDAVEIHTTVTRIAMNFFGADRCYYCEMIDSNAIIRRDASREDLPTVAGVYPLSSFPILKAVVDAGRPFVIEDAHTTDLLDESLKQLCCELQVISFIDVPVIKAGKPIGVLCITQTTPRNWTAFETELAQETAERIWAAVERARAETSLRESEAKYRSLFNSIDAGFCIFEMLYNDAGEALDFRYIETNPAFERQSGRRPQPGQTMRELFPEAEDMWLKDYAEVARTRQPKRFIDFHGDLDRWFDVFVFPTSNGNNQLAALFSDVTERQRAEAQLRRAAEMDAFRVKLSDALRSLCDTAEIEGIACRLLGEELKSDRVFYSEISEAEDYVKITQDYLGGDSPTLAGIHPLSAYSWVIPLYYKGEPIIISDVYNTDLIPPADLPAMEAAQVISYILIPLIKNNVLVGTLTASESVPRQWNEYEVALLTETAERIWAAVERARAEAALRESELERVREQSAREQERQRAEALAELDRAKTLFFSNISHEFRTPLTLSLAPLEDALSDRIHPLAPVHRERLELVHCNSLRLLKLVNTLLDFSRIEAGRMEAVYEPTDLALFTTELASVFRSAIERAGLRLIVDCPPLPELVCVDREMWEKIVLNLLSNAFKFTFEGEIRVSLGSADGDRAILQIQDTGTGIAPEHQPHLFERFYQVRATQARTHEGSGIGLALVHELVRLHGGTIEVSSTLGEGTCFTVSLLFGTEHLPSDRLQDEGDRIQPTRTQASTAMGAASYVEEAERWLPQSPLERGEQLFNVPFVKGDLGGSPESNYSVPASARVLLVDDNADMREYLTRILSEHVQVEAVADGAMALAIAQARVPDLILSDVMMPGLDGFELLEALRSDPRTREIPIILLSARAGEEAIVEGLEAGADDYLIKPFSRQELVSRVTAHLQTAQLRGEALQQERSLSRRKDELLSTVSHELNTPLVAILGWTRLLRANPPSQAMLSKALDTIERNATLQAKLVQDLLDISRITAGKLRLNLEPVELKSVIETAIATVAQSAQAKAIDLVWWETTAQSDSVIVMGDRDRLQQVICNLLTNAIKFTPEGGQVEVSSLTDRKRQMANEDYAEIRVTDSGIGISAEFLPFVFDRFRQAKDSNAVKGLGLGLAIAQHLVELHNGTIHATSAGIGQGATFIVRLPLLSE